METLTGVHSTVLHPLIYVYHNSCDCINIEHTCLNNIKFHQLFCFVCLFVCNLCDYYDHTCLTNTKFHQFFGNALSTLPAVVRCAVAMPLSFMKQASNRRTICRQWSSGDGIALDDGLCEETRLFDLLCYSGRCSQWFCEDFLYETPWTFSVIQTGCPEVEFRHCLFQIAAQIPESTVK